MSALAITAMRRLRVGYLAAAAALLALLWLIGLIRFVDALPRTVTDEETLTGAIVVLTGGRDRLGEGMTLLARGMADTLFVSGVYRGVEVDQIMRVGPAMPEGIDERVFLGHEATNTRGNAVETANWVADRHLNSLRLVTANYHMPRSLAEFRHAMPEVTVIPHPVAPEQIRLDSWWRWPGSARLLALEYSKYLLSRTRILFTAS